MRFFPFCAFVDNAAQKMLYGHFTVYNQTVVLNPERIFISRNIYSNDYLGGNGVGVWDPFSDYDLENFKDGDMNKSIFVTLGLMRKAITTTPWLSFTGRMPDSMSVTQEVQDLVYYDGCNAVAQFWNYPTDSSNYGSNTAYIANPAMSNSSRARKSNVICFGDYRGSYDPQTKRWSQHDLPQGHWGRDSCYPGAALVMRGKKMYFEIPDYAQTKKIEVV